jgi:hypothetical protein
MISGGRRGDLSLEECRALLRFSGLEVVARLKRRSMLLDKIRVDDLVL